MKKQLAAFLLVSASSAFVGNSLAAYFMEFNSETKAGAVPAQNPLPGVWEFWQKLSAANRGD